MDSSIDETEQYIMANAFYNRTQAARKQRWLDAGYTMCVFWEDKDPMFGAAVMKYFPTIEKESRNYMANLLKQAQMPGSNIGHIGCVKIEDM
jgi:hypothetical protein